MIQFTKMTGAGNDFVLIDNRKSVYSYDWALLAPKICDRRFGVGADGLLVLSPSDKADFMMLYYNADGSYGGMCGNGGRCVAGFVMENNNTDNLIFEALDYVYKAKLLNKNNIQLFMKPINNPRLGININIYDTHLTVHFINTGSPHVVVFTDQLPDTLKAEINSNGITEIGKEIRDHNAFKPDGANINFVDKVDFETIRMRTYERGVEDETLACGTGAVASAIMASLIQKTSIPVKVLTRSNRVLKVSFKEEKNRFTDVTLEGPIEKVFTGSYEPE